MDCIFLSSHRSLYCDNFTKVSVTKSGVQYYVCGLKTTKTHSGQRVFENAKKESLAWYSPVFLPVISGSVCMTLSPRVSLIERVGNYARPPPINCKLRCLFCNLHIAQLIKANQWIFWTYMCNSNSNSCVYHLECQMWYAVGNSINTFVCKGEFM